jgi:hypothetical protein
MRFSRRERRTTAHKNNRLGFFEKRGAEQTSKASLSGSDIRGVWCVEEGGRSQTRLEFIAFLRLAAE